MFILWFFWAPSLFCYYIHFLGFEMVFFCFFFFGVNSQMSISWDNDIKYLTLSCFLFIALHYVNVHIPNTIISIYSSPYSINLPHAVSLVRFQKWFFFWPFRNPCFNENFCFYFVFFFFMISVSDFCLFYQLYHRRKRSHSIIFKNVNNVNLIQIHHERMWKVWKEPEDNKFHSKQIPETGIYNLWKWRKWPWPFSQLD